MMAHCFLQSIQRIHGKKEGNKGGRREGGKKGEWGGRKMSNGAIFLSLKILDINFWLIFTF